MNTATFTCIALAADVVSTVCFTALTGSPWLAIAPWLAETNFAFPVAIIRAFAWCAIALLFAGAMDKRQYGRVCALATGCFLPGIMFGFLLMATIAAEGNVLIFDDRD